jgi:rhodanese-related sulfurtransferase
MTDPQNSVTNNLVAEFIYTYRASLEICPLAKEIEMSSDTPTVQEIDAATAKAWLDAGDAVLIDVREQPEFNEASIPVAEHNPMSSFDFDKVPRDGSKKVVIMCAHGMRSYQVADYLLSQGMLNEVYSMEGGIVAWAQAGFPHD